MRGAWGRGGPTLKNALCAGFHDALSYCNQAGLGAAVKDATAVKRSELFLMSMVRTALLAAPGRLMRVH